MVIGYFVNLGRLIHVKCLIKEGRFYTLVPPVTIRHFVVVPVTALMLSAT